MPILESQYRSPPLYNTHLATVWMGRLRTPANPAYIRERIIYDHNDYLDLDWLYSNSDKLVIITHGLEGSSKSHAVRTLAYNLNLKGYNILAWNLRGCSESPNNKLKSYCSGSSEQLSFIIEHVQNLNQFKKIFLIGISVGGNITLKYLGENHSNLSNKLVSALAVCPPCDLAGSSKTFEKFSNKIYLLDFLKSLKSKVKQRRHLLTSNLNYQAIIKAKTFAEFDRNFTGPVNGFKSEVDYYQLSSSLPVLDKISLPSLILTSKDDPFLSQSCFPYKQAEKSKDLYLEVAEQGGHVAFPWKNWLSQRALKWIESMR